MGSSVLDASAALAAGLSLGDRACLAIAARLSLTALTANRAWTGLDDLETEVEPIR